MDEIQMLPGNHYCGREFDMRITPAGDDNKNPVAWIIYGFCKKCKVVMVGGLFVQKEKPQDGRDFIIEYDKISGKGEEWKNENLKARC